MLSIFKKILYFSLLPIVVFILRSTSFASTAADQAEVKDLIAFVDKGIAYIKKYGPEKAFAEINSPNGQFREGDLYLFVYDYNGVCLAHGYDPKHMVGKNFYNIRDKFGTPVVQMGLAIAKRGGGFEAFYWPEPSTGEVQLKTVYIKPLGDKYVVVAGIYKSLNVPKDQIVKLEELKAFVHSAADYVKTYGKNVAYKEFSNPNGKFRNGDMYIFVINYQGTFLADGSEPQKYVGKNFLNYKDEFGTPAVQLYIETAKNGGGIVSDYWEQPGTGTMLEYNYVMPLDDNTLIGSSIFEK